MRRISDFVQVEVRPAKQAKQRGFHTETNGSKYCSVCGRAHRNRLGTVCSRPACHNEHLRQQG